MKKLALIACVLVLYGCKEITYKNPQPKGKKSLSEIPENLRGSYLMASETENTQDTVIVDSKGYMIASDRKRKVLGDSLVLKSYKGYYFVNINERPEWLLRIVTREPNGDLIFMSMDTNENRFQALLRKLAGEVSIDSLEINGEKLYQIDPTPRQMLKLIKGGYFSEISRMQKLP